MKKLRFKEADFTDEQISEQNAPESPAIQATPEEVSQATENATSEVPPVEETPEPSYNDVTTPEGSADATPEEVSGGTDDVTYGSGVSVQPETVSVEVQIPTQQLGQAVAMATGDVRTAETAPDIEAEKQAQAEEAEAQKKEDLVAPQQTEEAPSMGGEAPMAEPTVEEPAPVEEPQPVMESLDREALHEDIDIADEEEVEEDTNEMGASYRNLMKLQKEKELHESKNNFIDKLEKLSPMEKDKLKMTFENHPEFEAEIDWNKAKDYSYADFVNEYESSKETLHEDVNFPKGSPEKEDLVEEDTEEDINDEVEPTGEETPKKGKLNFKALSADLDDDENPDLPKGMGADEGGDFDDDLMSDFDSPSDDADTTDFANRISDVLGGKDADDINAVADTLRATADYIDDYADEAEDADLVEDEEDDTDFEDEEEPTEKLDFQALLNDEDYDSVDTARVDYETDDEDVGDFKESMFRRIDEKKHFNNGYSETSKYFKNIPCEDDECDECEEPRRARKPYKMARKPMNSRHRESMVNSTSRKQELVRKPISKDKKMNENLDFNSIIFPAGSEKVAEEYRDYYNDDLVSAHEKVLEARNRAINDFHKSIRESRERYSTPRYRESYREEETYRPRRNDRFREALNSSVRTSRIDERTSRNPNSWSNNRAIDKFEESEKFNFKELLKNGYLG